MGLDCGLTMRIPKKGFNEVLNFEIFYFRKCYSLSKKLQECALYFKDYAKNLEYDGEYGITIDLITHPDVGWGMAASMAALMDNEVVDFVQEINEINYEKNEFDYDAIWDVGAYIKSVNAAALCAHALFLFIKKKITFETLIDICHFDVDVDEDDLEILDFMKMELEFYYSY